MEDIFNILKWIENLLLGMLSYITFDNLGKISVLWSILTIVWLCLSKRTKYRIVLKCKSLFRKKIAANDFYKIGDLIFDDVVILDGIVEDFRFSIKTDNKEVRLPSELKTISQKLERENELRRQNNTFPIFTDLEPYAIKSISFCRDSVEGEKNRCIIHVRKSSYFNSLISILALDQKLRDGQTVKEKYYNNIIQNPYMPSPDGFNLVNALGVNVIVLTEDGKIVLAERNKRNVSTGKGAVHVSMGEHLNKEVIDLNTKGEIDLTIAARRGLFQELGLTVEECDRLDIRFYCIGFTPKFCQYGTFGFTEIELTSSELEERRKSAKDGKYETEKLHYITASLKAFIRFLMDTDIVITQWAMVSVILFLVQEGFCSLREANAVFSSHNISKFKSKIVNN